ncbi:SDR family oxidoreductase [Candidatus Roizmanbacteria bacterium]|nr:SDR family oxidoreductase [Candidatus Roizmanbacteria bacterium]
MKLKDKVVVITGASQGLGKAVALKVAREGAKVVLVARTEKLLKEVKEKINKDRREAEYFVCDIRDSDAIKKTVKRIFEKFKTIDILVNNAGVWSDEELEINKPEGRKNVVETNALGHINFTYEILPYFKKRNRGYIFNVISTSGVGDIPDGNNAAWKSYGASKWAIAGFTKALRDELKGTKIKVTGFFPGGFESNLYANAGRKNPHNQPWMMKTEDVADVVLFAMTRPEDVLIEKIVVAKM